jgi:small-conductance mechanosensitive channel
MTQDEGAIRNLKRREARIAAWTILTIMLCVGLACLVDLRSKMESRATAEHITSMVSPEPLQTWLPTVLSTLCAWSDLNARLGAITLFVLLCMGWVLANLIIDVSQDRHRLVLAMWGKIADLERRIEELNANQTTGG